MQVLINGLIVTEVLTTEKMTAKLQNEIEEFENIWMPVTRANRFVISPHFFVIYFIC